MAAGLRSRLWLIYLAVGALVCGLYDVLPPIAGNGLVVPALGISAVAAIVCGARMHRPRAALAWVLFAAGQALFAFGDVYTYSYPRLLGREVGFPSFGDFVYLALYPLLFAGVVIIARRRTRGRDLSTLIDSLILTVGLGVVSWVFLIAPYVHAQASFLEKSVSIAYPLADILLLAGALRLAVDTGKRQPAFYLLFCSIVTLLVTDFVYGLYTLHGTYAGQVWMDWGWMAYYLLWGAAALHPSMSSLEEVAPERETRLTPARLAVLTVACLVAPVFQVATAQDDSDMLVMIAASVGLFLLVVARMAGLVRQQERSVERERTLRSGNVALVAAASRAQISRAASEAATQLAGPGFEARLCLLLGERLAVIDETGAASAPLSLHTTRDLLAGEPCDPNDVGLAGRYRQMEILPLILRDEPRGVLVVAGETSVPASQHEALQSLATTVSLAIESSVLSEDLHRRESEARFSSLVARSSDLITVISVDGTVLYQSPSIERVLGYSTEEITGSRFDELLPEEERRGFLTVLARGAPDAAGPEAIECSLRHRDGRRLQFEILHSNLLSDEHVRGIVLNSRDVSERRAFEEQLAHQAFHDSLTKLANRALFTDRVQHALARATSEGTRLAVVFADLDDFKTINDSLGHVVGDEVLIEAATRLAATVRPTDTAARFGGDEFAVLIEGITHLEEAVEVAERILGSLQAPISVPGNEVIVRTSIGIAVAEPGSGATPADLLRNADVAMYIAKREGKGDYRVFEDSMHEEAIERLELRADLQRAIDGEQLELYYQPVVRLSDGAVSGVEALLRWHHPTKGTIQPTQFIPVAEEMGLILPIGQWVLAEACGHAVELQRSFPKMPPLTMAINLSPRHLNQGDIVADVRNAIEASGVDPSTLVLEITESLMMADTELAIRCLEELKQLGVRLAMDDFGTGYSSLSYLSRFPVDILKMDRSFLENTGGADVAGLAAAVVALGDTLSLQVVAEGIEQGAQADSLRALGCELGQGFLFARPMAIGDIRLYLDEAGLSPQAGERDAA
jgi:diguanylate cyclase (GGDEF)-like protein/PAS domain S-box-containing protein